MENCNFNLPYLDHPDTKSKYCKNSYGNCCSTCTRTSSSSRRRSRSENNDICITKCKEMRISSPTKWDKCCSDCENRKMNYGYDVWNLEKYKCRKRSNLMELPTSYIATNCQIPSMLKGDTDYLKNFNGINKIDRINFSNCENMKSNEKNIENINILEKSPKNLNPQKSCYAKSPLKSKLCCEMDRDDNCLYDQTYIVNRCSFKCPNSTCLTDRYYFTDRLHCSETETYFNREIDKEKYRKEVDLLREKLKILHSTSPYNSGDGNNLNTNGMENGLKESFIGTSPTKVKIVRKVPNIAVKQNKSKINLIKSKRNLIKIKRNKNRNGFVKPQSIQSEDSDSDSNIDDDDDDDGVVVDDFEDNSVNNTRCDDELNDGRKISDTQNESNLSISLAISLKGSGESGIWPIRSSLFPNIPPYIKFNSHDYEKSYKIPAGRKFFKWKLSTVTPLIVKKTLTKTGFILVRKSNQWLGMWGKHMKSPMFKTLKESQKLNHFPGTFHLGRKDRLWKNFQKMIVRFGQKEFGFLPHTYILPHELKFLKQNFQSNGENNIWIIKPPASARGTGIKVINKWSHFPKNTSLVCQKYITNPFLINGSKFDLRLYVLVTSFDPLRIYLYSEGLARFATVKYSDDIKNLKDRYMHLTNYSINKYCSQYTTNEDANACQGHKWTLSTLMEYMRKEGIDTELLWKNLEELIVKTFITSESSITPLCVENVPNNYNTYELFGIDVLLDENLKAWLLEVNISPSLHSASPLDSHVKGPLIQTVFDMAQFHFPLRLSQHVKNAPQCFDPTIYATNLTKREINKHKQFTECTSRFEYVYDILKDLNGDDVRQLTRAEDELVVKGNFDRIFPTGQTHKYLKFMEPRYYNRLFDAWETKYASRREDGIALLQTLCAQKIHLKVSTESAIIKNGQTTIIGAESVKHHPSKTNQN